MAHPNEISALENIRDAVRMNLGQLRAANRERYAEVAAATEEEIEKLRAEPDASPGAAKGPSPAAESTVR